MAGAAAETVLFGDFDRDGVRIDEEHWTQRIERHGCDDPSASTSQSNGFRVFSLD
jgi:hypothetical protein